MKTILKSIQVNSPVHRDGEYVAGIVTFEPIGTSRTRLNLKLFYDGKGSRRAEQEFLSSAGNRIERDLERFRKFIEEQDSISNRTGGIPR
jgi:hypothetical protein